jgi:N-acetylmuramic acid 6-phosphate etherase
MRSQSGTAKTAGGSIDALSRPEALLAMLQSHMDALSAMSGCLPQVDIAAGLVADALMRGATLHYAAAGSSALMGLADASELAGTFRVPVDQVRICMAGGVPVDARMPGDTEDDTDQAEAAARNVKPGDIAMVLSASGTTPYALAFARTARAAGARIIAIANVDGSALLSLADVAIALNTGPEVVSGSTRLGAGTAQKAALNMISTQAGILLGHVHDGLMVNLNPDNIKLRQRAATIVSQISGVDTDAAETALHAANFDTKLAVLLAQGMAPESAAERLRKANGVLRNCLSQ